MILDNNEVLGYNEIILFEIQNNNENKDKVNNLTTDELNSKLKTVSHKNKYT